MRLRSTAHCPTVLLRVARQQLELRIAAALVGDVEGGLLGVNQRG
jgi:hypothetical protein